MYFPQLLARINSKFHIGEGLARVRYPSLRKTFFHSGTPLEALV